ncbi:TPA: hypothetical protein ACH3X2_006406 [Trebouxia sp. C0005]
MGYFKMKHVPASVSISIADWLRKHGHAVRPALTKAERAQLEVCFALMDGDGSGAIDVDELSEAFHVLGLHVTKQAVRDLVARVDSDGSGEVELPEFIQIMTMTREAEQEATFWGDKTPQKHSRGDEAVPLHLLTAAYRRKRTVDAVMDPELRQVYIDSPGHANNSTATAAVEVLEEPAMDLSASFRQSMHFNVQETSDMGTAGTLFRSLAVDTFTPEPDDEDLYKPLTSNDRQTRREQIEEAVRARFAPEEADLQRVIEQRRWMSPGGRKERKGQPLKKQARSASRRVALSPPPPADMTASKSSKRERAAPALKKPAELADDKQDESNMMSVTMLLRRSPELDVATLGHMNLISSNTLRLPATPPSRCRSPDHVVSNTTHSAHKEVVSTRPVPKGRNTVVPHVVHLRDLQTLGGNADVSSESGGKEFEGLRRTMRGGQAWDLTQFGNTNGHSMAKHAQQGLTQRVQHGLGDAAVSASFRSTHSKVAGAQFGKHAVDTCMTDTAADDDTFDLYHLSRTLTMQPLPGLQEMQSKGRDESPNGARPLPQGSCSMQSPALDSYEAEAAAESQGSFSIQPPAFDSPLSRKASSVRFTVDSAFSPDTGTHDDSSQGVGASPEVMQTANSPSVDDRDVSIGVEGSPSSSSSSSPAGTIAARIVNRTMSSVSNTSSLKSALKHSVSNASSAAAPLSRGNSALKGSVSGVSFALSGGESSADQEADSAQDDALIKQGSESFPSWLTDGDDEALVQQQLSSALGAEKLTQDEDEQQEQAASQCNSIWSSRDVHMSPEQSMQQTKGMKLVPALTSDDVCGANPTCSVLLQCDLC